jgi:hypothetical protein
MNRACMQPGLRLKVLHLGRASAPRDFRCMTHYEKASSNIENGSRRILFF